MELSENCAETRPSFWSAPIWKGYLPLCIGAGNVSGDALCKTWSQSRRLLYTVQSREAKTEIPAELTKDLQTSLEAIWGFAPLLRFSNCKSPSPLYAGFR